MLGWIDENSREQINWACDYLVKKHMLALTDSVYDKYHSADNKEKIELLSQKILEHAYHQNDAQRAQPLINQMKATWRKRSSRMARKSEMYDKVRERTIIISDDVWRVLELKAQSHKVTLSQMVEMLITQKQPEEQLDLIEHIESKNS